VRRQTPSARLAQGGGPNILISLDAIRQEAGARWEKMRDTIYARLEALLRLRLASTDFFLPIDEVSYLVSMPNSSVEDAQVSCLRIAYELHSGLLGPCSMQHLQIATAHNSGDDVLELTPVVSRHLAGLAERAQILDLLVERNSEPAAPAPQSPQASPPQEREVPRYEFTPIWDMQREVVRAYRCGSIAHLCASANEAADPPSVRTREAARLALGTLQRAATALEEHLTHGERFLVTVPVTYEALTAPVARMEFASACRQLACDLRPYLVYEISEMPHGVPHSRLIDLVGSLKSFGRGVVAQLPIESPCQDVYEGTGLIGLGFALPPAARQIPLIETERLCAVGRRLGIGTFLGNIATADALRFAIDAGVQWLSGPLVAPALPEPKPMCRLPRSEVLQRARATSPPPVSAEAIS